MESQKYFNMADAYRQMYLTEKPEGEGGKPGQPPHYYPVPPFGRRPAVMVKNTTNVSVDVDTKDTVGPGEVEKAYYTYSAGFDPTNREDVAKKDYDGSKTRSEDVDLDAILIDVCDFLMEEGFAESPEGAEAMYDHMSDDWFQVIMEKKGRCWTGYKPTPGKKAFSPGSCEKA